MDECDCPSALFLGRLACRWCYYNCSLEKPFTERNATIAQENVAKFIELIRSDEALQAKLNEAFEAYEGPKDGERALFEATIAPIAAEAGLPCTYEEGLGFATEGRELSEGELEAVAGGDYDDYVGDRGACYYIGISDGPGAWLCEGPLSGTAAACVWAGITLG